MKASLKKASPLYMSIIICLGLTAGLYFLILLKTNGHFCYPLDDTFIHMAIAKNIALHKVWGITPYHFSSASSSPFYSLLLAFSNYLFGANFYLPLIINLILAVLFYYVTWWILCTEQVSNRNILYILSAITVITPVPVMIIVGMEHILHFIFCFLFLYLSIKLLNNISKNKKLLFSIVAVAGLMIFSRYEGLFMVAMLCLCLFTQRRFAEALLIGILSLVPIIIFGIYSMHMGGFFLPNSVLLKGHSTGFSVKGIMKWIEEIVVARFSFGNNLLVNAFSTTYNEKGIPSISGAAITRLLIFISLFYLLLFRNKKISKYHWGVLIVTGTIFLHIAFASVGWLYRYEAYLVACSILVIGLVLSKYDKKISYSLFRNVPNLLVSIVVFLLLLVPTGIRAALAFGKTPAAAKNIYDQQYQMGNFLKTYYVNASVAANDIGSINYFTHIHNLDLWGLGNIKVARSKQNNTYNYQFLDSLVKQNNVQIAVIYDGWFDDKLTSKWAKVASWEIPDNVICGESTVYFYAIDKNEKSSLEKHLKIYQRDRLPSDISVKYYNNP